MKERPSAQKSVCMDGVKPADSHGAPPQKTKRESSSFSAFRKVWLIFIALIGIGFAFVLVLRLYDIQINQYEEYSLMASELHWRRIKDNPVRGEILDANGNVLAGTTYEYTVGVTPKDVRSLYYDLATEDIAASFSEILDLEYDSVFDGLQSTELMYVQLCKQRTKEQIDAFRVYLRENGIGGVRIDPIPKRYYVYDHLAAQVIGFADQSDEELVGQYGIEAYYDDILTGTPGYSYVEVDISSGALPYSPPTTMERQDGHNVVLHLDKNIQEIAERACREAYEAYRPIDGVTAIVMNPNTGAVYAMVSIPDYNLNTPREIPYDMDSLLWESLSDEDRMNHLMSNVWRNRTISDTYEPGSTFKAITTAIAFEEGLAYEDEIFSDEPIEVSEEHTIACWRYNRGEGHHGDQTLREAFSNSCNPAFVQMAWRIGIDKYYQYILNFGFFEPTGVDLPAEGSGIFHALPNRVDLATLSFGESSTVTPLQLTNVFCALVNGGSLMRPQLVHYLSDNDGNVIREYSPEVVRTVFSEQTSERVMALMKDVVMEGTGTAGYVEGYFVAGKTSTSTVDAGMYEGMSVLSFASYAPSYNPEIVVLVVINKPQTDDLGSSAAARVAADIIGPTLEYLDVPRVLTEADYQRMTTRYALPSVEGMTLDEARSILYNQGYHVILGEPGMKGSSIISHAYPDLEETILYRGGVVVLYTSDPEDMEYLQVPVPDFVGKSIYECMSIAHNAGLNIMIQGDPTGRVISQSPAFGFVEPDPEPDPDSENLPADEINTEEEESTEANTEITDEQTDEQTDSGENADVDVSAPVRVSVPAGSVIIITME